MTEHLSAHNAGGLNPVVGVWEVWADDAPFDHHVMMFTAEGMMLQSNPDSGNTESSDSMGMGIWRAERDLIVGKFLETKANRATGLGLGRAVVRYELRVNGDGFAGQAVSTIDSRNGEPVATPSSTSLRGIRFTAD